MQPKSRRFYNEHVRTRHTPRVVLFDLDDTLFDHEHAARTALARVHRLNASFAGWPFAAFEQAHSRVLEELHLQVLAGSRSIDEAREERFRRLFAEVGAADGQGDVRATAAAYREAYMSARRAIDGAVELLAALKPRVRIGIVTNNLLEEQQAKITLCGFDPYVDALVVSEAVGVSKPDPAIFEYALRALGCDAADAVMVGDSWAADVEGARGAGIRPIWFNRAGRRAPAASTAVTEVSTLVPMTAVMTAIFGPTDADVANSVGAAFGDTQP